jgi:hypothetical protein
MLDTVSPGVMAGLVCDVSARLNRTRFHPVMPADVTVPLLQPPTTCVMLSVVTTMNRGDVVVHWPPSR